MNIQLINLIKFFKSLFVYHQNKRKYSSFSLNNKLNPYFVTGFADGESSFMISITQDTNFKID